MNFPSQKRGIVLVAAVMLMVFASMVVAGVTVFIVQRLSGTKSNDRQLADLYLAQAGIHYALYHFREHDRTGNGYYSLGSTQVDSQRHFIVGGREADRLMVKTSLAAMNNRLLTNLTIQNASNTKSIRIDRMVVDWNNSRRLRTIVINGITVWTGNRSHPVDADIAPNVVLNTTPTIYPINSLEFSGQMTGATVTVDFVMKDGSEKNVQVYPATNNNNFTVEATGKITGLPGYRTIRAQYNSLTGRISQYSEVGTETSY